MRLRVGALRISGNWYGKSRGTKIVGLSLSIFWRKKY